jgi:hypothetical protein
MILEYTTDESLIRQIMTDDDIWCKIAKDIKKEDFKPKWNKNIIALTVKTNEVIGMVCFCLKPDGVYFHPMILKPFRLEYARKAIDMAIDWYFKHMGMFLMCEIPEDHKKTINLAKKTGFKTIASRDNLNVMRLEK